MKAANEIGPSRRIPRRSRSASGAPRVALCAGARLCAERASGRALRTRRFGDQPRGLALRKPVGVEHDVVRGRELRPLPVEAPQVVASGRVTALEQAGGLALIDLLGLGEAL